MLKLQEKKEEARIQGLTRVSEWRRKAEYFEKLRQQEKELPNNKRRRDDEIQHKEKTNDKRIRVEKIDKLSDIQQVKIVLDGKNNKKFASAYAKKTRTPEIETALKKEHGLSRKTNSKVNC